MQEKINFNRVHTLLSGNAKIFFGIVSFPSVVLRERTLHVPFLRIAIAKQ
jgi:hypothetical protein